ncbi:MAG: hypothetical protein IKS00_04770 [Bacteroidales bacterium]|nr:hypothetical protein [Bacteroidales bacterium]
MKIKLLVLVAIVCCSASCSRYPDFATAIDDSGSVRISHGGKSIVLNHDTAWYVEIDGEKHFYADPTKVSAFFNSLRDFEIQGLSNYSPEKDFQYTIEVRSSGAKVIKTLRFNQVPSSPNMVGSCNGSECYIVGIPGQSYSPTENFHSDAGFWKPLLLLDIVAANISKISVTDFTDQNQSFSISLNVDTFVVRNFENMPQAISQKNIRYWLGSLTTFHAAEFCPTPDLPDSLKIYEVCVKPKNGGEQSVTFYKKYLSDNAPDFNRMWFETDGVTGTAKYFDFDFLLIGLDKLRD